MSLALNKPKLDNLAGDIWKSAERLRGKFKAYEYQNVVLPIIVIRRLECVLINWRQDKAAEVLAKRPKLTEKELAKLVKGLENSTAQFSNKTDWTLRKVYEEDHTLIEENFCAYITRRSRSPSATRVTASRMFTEPGSRSTTGKAGRRATPTST